MLKRILKYVFFVAIGLFVAIQFIPAGYTYPETKKGETLGEIHSMPPDVAQIIKTSCADCHSHDTVYPFYSNIAPVKFLMAKDIREGRDELNFSVWGSYSEKRRKHKLEEMCEEVGEGEMPLSIYLVTHRDAVLDDAKKKALCDWTKSTAGTIKVADSGKGGDGKEREEGDDH
ncbi:MAG: heme-binding domain-containing protein [Pyrinomonadaceae bacterium]